MMENRAVPRQFMLASLLVFGGGLVCVATSARVHPLHLTLGILAAAILGFLSENYAPVVAGYGTSIGLPLTIAALIYGGPAAGSLVAVVSALRRDTLASPHGFLTTVYNLGQFLLVTIISGELYLRMGGRTLQVGGEVTPFHQGDLAAAFVPLMLCGLVCALSNVALTVLGLVALYGVSPLNVLRQVWTQVPAFMAFVAVGLLIAQVMAASPVALVLFAVPLFLAREVYQRYALLEIAHIDALRSLIGALEAKDAYTRGHSERVAGYALMAAEGMGLDEMQRERLHRSALLHDIGKLSVPAAVLREPGPLNQTQRAVVDSHAGAGAAMMRAIPRLRDLAAIVESHHERLDGTGYPQGLRADEISVLARVLAVADAYDAMTSDRPYRSAMGRDEALRRLELGSGSQFDPTVVAALSKALDQRSRLNADDLVAELELAAGVSS